MRNIASLLAKLPDNIRLSKRAVKTLDRLSDKEAAQIIEDIVRIHNKTFPGEIKKIHSLPTKPWQVDYGRFRALFERSSQTLDILLIFPKSLQRSTFKGLR